MNWSGILSSTSPQTTLHRTSDVPGLLPVHKVLHGPHNNLDNHQITFLKSLVPSIKYNAIQLNRVSVVIIGHLALAGLVYSIFTLLTLGYVVHGENVYTVSCHVTSSPCLVPS